MEVGTSGSPSHPVDRGTPGGSDFVYKPHLAGRHVYMARGKTASGGRVTRFARPANPTPPSDPNTRDKRKRSI